MLGITRQICEALAEAHGLGIIHRDLKPTNIHLERMGGDEDFVKVLDFGIAKILHGSALDSADLTRSGQMVGTFDYMAPEQMVGSACTPQTDIYTLGLVMYEMITGERPFGEAPSAMAQLQAMITQAPRPVSTLSDAPEEIDAIIRRCIARDPEQRFSSVDELAAVLDGVLALAGDATKTQLTAAPDGEGPTTWTHQIVTPQATLPGVMPPRRKT
jgi:serine/threonine-protein kinase